MSTTDLPESHRERTESDRRSAIVDEIVAATGATLGFAGAREPSPRRPAIVDTIAAVIIAALALAVLLCLAAISPVVWTFASDTASHLRSELSQCLSVEDGGTRLACYDEIAHRPLRPRAVEISRVEARQCGPPRHRAGTGPLCRVYISALKSVSTFNAIRTSFPESDPRASSMFDTVMLVAGVAAFALFLGYAELCVNL